MYYAGILNLLVGMLNAGIYTQNGYLMSLCCACMSVGVGITIFVIIKRKTQAILWDKLTKTEDKTTEFNPS